MLASDTAATPHLNGKIAPKGHGILTSPVNVAHKGIAGRDQDYEEIAFTTWGLIHRPPVEDPQNLRGDSDLCKATKEKTASTHMSCSQPTLCQFYHITMADQLVQSQP